MHSILLHTPPSDGVPLPDTLPPGDLPHRAPTASAHETRRKGAMLRRMFAIGLAAAMLGGPTAIAHADTAPDAKPQDQSPAVISTADTPTLHTWWHDNAEASVAGGLKDATVRESPFYSTKVASANAPTRHYDAFTYLSVPRSGNDKIGYSEEDGAEFAADAGMTMSWSSFEYSKDAQVDVSLNTGKTVSSVDDVTIRPLNDNFKKELINDHTVRITVPYSDAGYRFSVEFAPEVVTVYNNGQGGSGQPTLDDNDQSRKVESEPRNAMLVFAQPKLDASGPATHIPDRDATNVYSPAQGAFTESELDHLPKGTDTLYFAPGTYFMGSSYRATLPQDIRWVYLAPGAYVKGAFEFQSENQTNLKVTGYGVLSGEQYVYEADTNNGYHHLDPNTSDCHGSCVKMLQFASPKSGPAQTLDLQGVTVANPPYHTFVMYGNEDGPFAMTVTNYQQIGAWYWQTDGLELYRGSTLRNSFFHSNDDVIKIYHSNVTADNNVIWKNENGPVIQWGWGPRTIDDVKVTDTDVIHNRMYWKDKKFNTCVLNSSTAWQDMGATDWGDTKQTVSNLTISNTRVEGMVNCAVRIYAMQNTKHVTIDGLHIDQWNDLDASNQVNEFKAQTDHDGTPVTIGNQTRDHEGLLLHNYTVGGETIRKAGDNWAADEPGRLDFDANLWDNWDATGDDEPSGVAPTLAVKGITDGSVATARRTTITGTTNASDVTVTINGDTTKAPVTNGAFSATVTLPDVTNRVRVTARGANGVMNVARYTVYAYGTQVGSLSDPTGDDNGPGTYRYPSNGAFSKGSFDMKDFRVFQDGDTIRFVTTVNGQIANPWGGNGMSTQRLNIYLSDQQAATVRSISAPTALLPGTNTFSTGAWSKVIVVDGRHYDGDAINAGVYTPDQFTTDEATDKTGEKTTQPIAPITLNVLKGDTIVTSVDKSALSGIDLAKAGYQVSMFSSAESRESVGNVRPVYQGSCPAGTDAAACPLAQDFFFVGGLGEKTDDSPYDSVTTDTNAIDAFTGKDSQAELLSLQHDKAVLPFLNLDPVQQGGDDHNSTDNGNNSGSPSGTNGSKNDTHDNTTNGPSQGSQTKGSARADATTTGARTLANTGATSLVVMAFAMLLVGLGAAGIRMRMNHRRQS
ncbi:MAG: glucodextranase DOMON-like domain-containing protein [Bifidobacterium mongoliense]|jgi:hypothetical protein|uniref:glucodextranase DOMON-like domain-containing protein n=2 Tax=Bifidobacterium mongoliense TaxID=518643 RepID=UPI002F35D35B